MPRPGVRGATIRRRRDEAVAPLLEVLEDRLLLAAAITGDILSVSPDPRGEPVQSIQIAFSQAVEDFGKDDLVLLRSGVSLDLASASLASANGLLWTLSGLAELTSAAGSYVLSIADVEPFIQSSPGGLDTMAPGVVSDAWTMDLTAPTAAIAEVAPNPRTSSVNSIQIVFSEIVTMFTRDDLVLTRDQVPLDLSDATLTAADAMTWTLGNLAGLTGAEGTYALSLTAAGVMDMAANPVREDATRTWLVDLTGPSADVLDVRPDPRNSFVPSVQVTFTEPAAGLTAANFTLTRGGAAVDISGAVLSTADNVTWTLENLAGATGAEGLYVLEVSAAGVADLLGNPMPLGATDSWLVDNTAPTAQVLAVLPQARKTVVESVEIRFSEPVSGFTTDDLSMTLDGQPRPMAGATLSTEDGIVWTLGNLCRSTGSMGAYEITLHGDSIIDSAGNPVAEDAARQWLLTTAGPAVGIAAEDANIGEGAAGGGRFLVSRTGSVEANLDVYFDVLGSAGNGVDYRLISRKVTIPAGRVSAAVVISPLNDQRPENDETVVLRLRAHSAYKIDPSAPKAALTILDDDQRVRIEATTPQALEEGGSPGRFTITRSVITDQPLTVKLSIGGNACYGLDYAAIVRSVVIAPGAATATVDVMPLDDSRIENDEQVTARVLPSIDYSINPSLASAGVAIIDNECRVRIEAVTPMTSEGGLAAGQFLVSRSVVTDQPLTVRLQIGGGASNGRDYTWVAGTATILARQQSAVVSIAPLDDARPEQDEKVAVRILSGAGYSIDPQASRAELTILDNDCRVSIAAEIPQASEEGSVAGKFTITRSVVTDQPLTVYVSGGGSAAAGADYQALPRSVVIPAGLASASLDVRPADDARAESDETVSLRLLSTSQYSVDALASGAQVVILDNDCRVRIESGDPTASETAADTAVFTVSRSIVTAQPLTVYLSIDGTARMGYDYQTFGRAVVIPANLASATVAIVPMNDNTPELNEEILVRALPAALCSIDPARALIRAVIVDND